MHCETYRHAKAMRDNFRRFDSATLITPTPYDDRGTWDDGSIGMPDFDSMTRYHDHFSWSEQSTAHYFQHNPGEYNYLRSQTGNEWINMSDLNKYIADYHWQCGP
jgi:hypothetical protein